MTKTLRRHLDAVEEEIETVKAKITAVESFQKAQALHERMKDLETQKAALEGKLQAYERAEKEAAKIRDEISATWTQLFPLMEGFIQAQQNAREMLRKIETLRTKIKVLAVKHIDFTGEPFHPPELVVPREVRDFCGVELKPLTAWNYVSDVKDLAYGYIPQVQSKAELTEEGKVRSLPRSSFETIRTSTVETSEGKNES